MASLRDELLEHLVSRIAALPGWTARRVSGQETTNVPRLALVVLVDEDKQPRDTWHYECRANVLVLVRGRQEDAGEEHGGNPLRYLDELVAQIEDVVHGPVTWPQEAIVSLQGHEVLGPDEGNGVHAAVQLLIQYRHDFSSPNTYDPHLEAAP